MLLSLYNLRNSFYRFRRRRRPYVVAYEGYDINDLVTKINTDNSNKNKNSKGNKDDDNGDEVEDGVSAAVETVWLMISIIFFIMEFLLFYFMFFAIMRCAKNSPEKIIHVVLLLLFTLPYCLFVMLYDNSVYTICAKESLSSFTSMFN